MSDYPARCASIAVDMQRDGWPLKHSPLEWAGRYEQMWAAEFMARLLGESGIPCPDLTGTAYEGSWLELAKTNGGSER